jgi:hypothetical protein
LTFTSPTTGHSGNTGMSRTCQYPRVIFLSSLSSEDSDLTHVTCLVKQCLTPPRTYYRLTDGTGSGIIDIYHSRNRLLPIR